MPRMTTVRIDSKTKTRLEKLAKETRPRRPKEVKAPDRFEPTPWKVGQWVVFVATVKGQPVVQRVTLTDTTDPLNRVDLLPTVSVTVRDPAKAPEPASFCLTAAGTALMLLHMFRRKRRQSGDPTP